jgi:hypothetical protein
MTDGVYCGEEIKKDDDFILVGKFPSGWEKWKDVRLHFHSDGQVSPEDFGMIYHKSCFLEMMKKEGVPRAKRSARVEVT